MKGELESQINERESSPMKCERCRKRKATEGIVLLPSGYAPLVIGARQFYMERYCKPCFESIMARIVDCRDELRFPPSSKPAGRSSVQKGRTPKAPAS